jgi:hypothetical protein
LIAGLVQNQKIVGVGPVFVVSSTNTKSFAGIDGSLNSRNVYLN